MRRGLADAALAVALAAMAVTGTWLTKGEFDPWAMALAAAAGLALAGRRRWPLPTLAVVTVLTTVYLLLDFPYGPILFTYFLAVYTVARHVPLPRSAVATAVAAGVLLTHLLGNSAALPGLLGVIPATAWAAVPFAIGYTVRVAREAAERARAEAIRQVASDERLRVAQEVHDVVGHGLAAIKMQADVALHVLAKRPEQAQAALAAISRSSAQALDELRATLAVVRGDGRAPAPGLDRLGELCRRMGEAGLVVHLNVTGERPTLSAAADLAGYRVVQESLTNALRHGPAASTRKEATVTVEYRTGEVAITVSNPLGAASDTGGGLGVPGMRERVTALGGRFRAGPDAAGRFEVAAVIPVGERHDR